MLEQFEHLSWWEIDCGENGVHKVTERQMSIILQAESQGTRLVLLDNIVINIAFIKFARKVEHIRDSLAIKSHPLDDQKKKFLIKKREELSDAK